MNLINETDVQLLGSQNRNIMIETGGKRGILI